MTDFSKVVKFLNSLNESQSITLPQNGLVYHYTSANAFISIIEHGTLRFTDRNYLNDKSEGKYVLELIAQNDYFSALWESSGIFEIFKALCEKRQNNPNKKGRHVCQCSFSKQGDHLPMWNYYSKSNQAEGFNIAFSVEEIKNAVCILDLIEGKTIPRLTDKGNREYGNGVIRGFCGDVIYDVSEQQKRIKKILRLAQDYMEKNVDQEDYEFFLDCILDKVIDAGTFFKHPSFRVEEEFRIVFYFYECEYFARINEAYCDKEHSITVKLPYKFTYRNGLMIPHIDLVFDKKWIKEIYFSATINEAASKSSVEDLMRVNGLNPNITKKSGIPIRY